MISNPLFDQFAKVEPLMKGWSTDQKYIVETIDHQKLLLRLSDRSEYDKKVFEYEMMARLAVSGIPMPQPVDFGLCENGRRVYSLITWCDGEDAELVLPSMTAGQQFDLGVASGRILQKIHTIPAPADQENWSSRFNRKADIKIRKYQACGIRFAGDRAMIEYIEQNRRLLEGRPQCFQHGDYHVGNMVISPSGRLSVINWNRPDFGDPWEEFNRIVWSAAVSPSFATGQLEGYFDGKPPLLFFQLLAFYIASNTLSSIYWAIPFGDAEVDTMMRQSQDVLRWFDDMKNPVPAWYGQGH